MKQRILVIGALGSLLLLTGIGMTGRSDDDGESDMIRKTRAELEQVTRGYERQSEEFFAQNPHIKRYGETAESAGDKLRTADRATSRFRREHSDGRAFDAHYETIRDIRTTKLLLERIASPDTQAVMREYFVEALPALKKIRKKHTSASIPLHVGEYCLELLRGALPPAEGETLAGDPALFWQTEPDISPDTMETLEAALKAEESASGFSPDCLLHIAEVAEQSLDWLMYAALVWSSTPENLIKLEEKRIRLKMRLHTLEKQHAKKEGDE